MTITIHENHDELTAHEFEELKRKTLDARNLSYSPYSKFRVGCCLITQTGEFIDGANVENASYGACICAERTALTRAIVSGHRKFKALAVSTDDENIASPCGICRQFIREFGPQLPIFLISASGKWVKVYLDDLLPMSFGPENLGIKGEY